jgi:hypothetical protein
MVTEQLELAPEPGTSVHVPPGLNVTVPVGALAVPAIEVSVTVAVHVVD